MNIKETEDLYELPLYPRRDIVLERGKGCYLYDSEGKEYIDCASNVGVSNIGHGNEEVARAIFDQYSRLASCYGIFYNDMRASLAKKMAEISPHGLSRAFFCNSGSESVEAAIKFSRASTGKEEIICAMRGFHGKTMGSLSATWSKDYHRPFAPLLPGFVHVPFDNIERLTDAVTEKTCAVLLEPIQGEGGVRVASKEYFTKVRDLCNERGILLVMDEVQTGFGRTGRMFACEHYTIPDILCVAKSIAGGLPMGAVMCNDKVSVPMKSHTSTFGGSPLACAAALASIEFIEREGLPRRAEELGEYFMTRLRSLDSPKVREVRGLGLMIGIELKERAGPYVQSLMEKGVIALLAGDIVIRLLPPLVIGKDEIDRVVVALEEVLC